MKKTTTDTKISVRTKGSSQHPRDKLTVTIKLFGPDSATVARVRKAVMKHPTILKYLKGARFHVLSFELVDREGVTKRTKSPSPPKNFRATIYDYTKNRTIFADGLIDDPSHIEVSESGVNPLPDQEEFEAAIQILMKDPAVGDAVRNKRLAPYQPMPPLIEEELPDGRVERVIAIGLLPLIKGQPHEIVGVNMIHQTVKRYEKNAPARAVAHNPICGITNAGQGTAMGIAGQMWVTVSMGAQVLWRFLIVRPAGSSGTNGSGIELRYVDYRGKRVLYRAHVPILNVKYDNDYCGPYRDWQKQEGMIQATGTDVAPAFRLCSAPAQTILDTGSDVGNFLGTAIYVEGLEVILVCEMQAGWYRYISEWRLHADGTIRPRFGFSAVQSSCVCTRHHHHAYWRLDFDIRTPGGNVVREYNNPPIFPTSNWHSKYFEIRRPRDYARHRKWRVENMETGQAYDIIPGSEDGVATLSPDWPFPRGDVWILRYHWNEIDDGVVATGPPYEANIDGFLNSEWIYGQDVVIWYASHVTHDVLAEPPGVYGHIVGPTLKPVNW